MTFPNPNSSNGFSANRLHIRLKKPQASSPSPPPPPPLRDPKSIPSPDFQPPPPNFHEYNSANEEEEEEEVAEEEEEDVAAEEEEVAAEVEEEDVAEEEEEEEVAAAEEEEDVAAEEEEEEEDVAARGEESIDGDHSAYFSDDKDLTFSDVSLPGSPDQLLSFLHRYPCLRQSTDEQNLTATPASANGSSNKKKKSIEDSDLQSPELKQLALERQMLERAQNREDEILILQSLLEFSSKDGKIPSSSSEMDAFYEFVNKSLNVDASRKQLVTKIRQLKKKYEMAAARGKDGMDPSFKIAHNWSTYCLSKQIWGQPNMYSTEGDDEDVEEYRLDEDSSRKRRMPKGDKFMSPRDPTIEGSSVKAEEDDGFYMEGILPIPLLRGAVSKAIFEKRRGFVVENALEMLDGSEAMILEEKYKKQSQEEMMHALSHMDLLKETLKLFMDALDN